MKIAENIMTLKFATTVHFKVCKQVC